MGRRSRKRGGPAEGSGEPQGAAPAPRTTRAERDAARARRAEASASGRPERPRQRSARRGTGERPPAPWGSFPLVELVMLLALVLGAVGLTVWGDRGRTMLAAAVALSCLVGLELSIREHFAGFRSHTTLLSGAAAIAATVVVFLIAGPGRLTSAILLIVAALVFAIAFRILREVFRRRSGGLSFR